MRPKILAFAGSARKESLNKLLVRAAAAGARAGGADVTLVDFLEFPMPLYDGDLESGSGIPAEAARFKALLVSHHGFLISSPEYNSSISPLLKNAFDWASRPAPGEKTLVAFRGKTAALLSASPGDLGGLRGLVTVRSILGNIGVFVLPDQMALPKAHEAFGIDGALKDEKLRARAEGIGRSLAEFTAKVVAT